MKQLFDFLIANPLLVVAVVGAVVVLILGAIKGNPSGSQIQLWPLPGPTPAPTTTGVVAIPNDIAGVPVQVAVPDLPRSPVDGFKNALAVAECLRANGYPESEVEAFVNSIAAKLLVKKV